MAKRGILERLAQGVILGDGGYILELERRGYVQAGPFTGSRGRSRAPWIHPSDAGFTPAAPTRSARSVRRPHPPSTP